MEPGWNRKIDAGARGGTRTPDAHLRRVALYPLSYAGMVFNCDATTQRHPIGFPLLLCVRTLIFDMLLSAATCKPAHNSPQRFDALLSLMWRCLNGVRAWRMRPKFRDYIRDLLLLGNWFPWYAPRRTGSGAAR